MTREKGMVDRVRPGRSRNGSQYLSVQINGRRYTVWDARLFELFQPGEHLEYEWKERNGYPVITSAKQYTAESAEQEKRAGEFIFGTEGLSREELRRLHCLHLGLELYRLTDPFDEGQDPIDAVMDYALVLEEYVSGRTEKQAVREKSRTEAIERLKSALE